MVQRRVQRWMEDMVDIEPANTESFAVFSPIHVSKASVDPSSKAPLMEDCMKMLGKPWKDMRLMTEIRMGSL